MTNPAYRSGFVAIVGRPNVGKSTLLNTLLGTKIAIVTPKPQTTRRRLLGIKTLPHAQLLFVDTPGIHSAESLMNQRMVERARAALDEADVALWLLDATQHGEAASEEMVALLCRRNRPIVAAVNKIDLVQKNLLLPLIEQISSRLPEAHIVPISALRGENIERLIEVLAALVPEGPQYYSGDQITDQTERELVAEIVREKVMLQTRDEVPYAVAVSIDSFQDKEEKNLIVIQATIHVARDSQKPIVIGHKGQRLKEIGKAARVEIEKLLGSRVYLELFVRVQPDWTRKVQRLKEFGL